MRNVFRVFNKYTGNPQVKNRFDVGTEFLSFYLLQVLGLFILEMSFSQDLENGWNFEKLSLGIFSVEILQTGKFKMNWEM